MDQLSTDNGVAYRMVGTRMAWPEVTAVRAAMDDGDRGEQRESVCFEQCIYSTEFLQIVLA